MSRILGLEKVQGEWESLKIRILISDDLFIFGID
jgi:hypothetical protein